MEMIKPDTLFCASQPLDWRGTPHQAFSALLGIDLRTGGALAAEGALAAAMSALPPGCRLDAGIPKQEAEWLLAGTVTPQAREGSVIEIRVGKSRRRFLVKAAPDGKPVPLTWKVAAFDPAGNPLGSKDAPLLADPALPHGAPACPLPLGAWPCRMKGLGTYDARWLQNRWPGLPDDADWHFFNEAQPQQRLPGGLRGDEEIFLSSFGPETPEQHVRLPGVRLRLEVLRTGETEWKGQAIAADTLWLFPVERTALICWHALVPCADEKPSDIAAARFLLSPEQAASAPPPAAPAANVADAHIPAAEQATAAGPSMPGMSAAGMTAAAAATTVAAGAAAASAAKAGTAPDAPGSTPQEAAPAPPPGPAPRSQAELAANLHADLEESLPEFNAVLAQAGLPPLTPEQIAETRQHLDRLSAEAAALQASPPPPPLEEQLRQAGLSEERIAAVNAALDLELPDPTEYADAAAWQAASEAFLARFSALMQPSDSLTDTMSQTLRLMGPEGEASLKAMSGNLPNTPSAVLQKAGMSPAAADRLLELLDDAPDDLDALTAYATVLEAGAGFRQARSPRIWNAIRRRSRSLRPRPLPRRQTRPRPRLPRTSRPSPLPPRKARRRRRPPTRRPPPRRARRRSRETTRSPTLPPPRALPPPPVRRLPAPSLPPCWPPVVPWPVLPWPEPTFPVCGSTASSLPEPTFPEPICAGPLWWVPICAGRPWPGPMPPGPVSCAPICRRPTCASSARRMRTSPARI